MAFTFLAERLARCEFTSETRSRIGTAADCDEAEVEEEELVVLVICADVALLLAGELALGWEEVAELEDVELGCGRVEIELLPADCVET